MSALSTRPVPGRRSRAPEAAAAGQLRRPAKLPARHPHRSGRTSITQALNNPRDRLSIVCFGASAGGFAAYRTILSLLSADTGMAYIVVHHQPAQGKSLLADILSRVTDMPVVLVADGEIVRANHVYVVPAGKQVTMAGDLFRLTPLVKPPGWPKNISIFLKTLADDRQKRAIVVILSGYDSDGAAALQSIKDAGGLVFAQDFGTAAQPDMPESAVRTGCVDQILSPVEIAAELQRIGESRAWPGKGFG